MVICDNSNRKLIYLVNVISWNVCLCPNIISSFYSPLNKKKSTQTQILPRNSDHHCFIPQLFEYLSNIFLEHTAGNCDFYNEFSTATHMFFLGFMKYSETYRKLKFPLLSAMSILPVATQFYETNYVEKVWCKAIICQFYIHYHF